MSAARRCLAQNQVAPTFEAMRTVRVRMESLARESGGQFDIREAAVVC